MKYFKILSLIFLAAVMLAFKAQYTGAIQGKFLPANGIQEISVVSGPDTIKVSQTNGSFLLKNLQSKTYTVIVKALPPYQDYTLNDVAVIDSATTDIGEIKLLQD